MCNCNPTSSTSSSSSVIPVGSGGCGTCQDGVSSYTYVAYANTVSNQGIGNPNYTVTGFGANPTANTQWLGIITTSSPIANPTAANFNTFWTQIAGPGAGGGSGTMEVQEFGTSVVPSATVLNFLASDLTGVNVTNMGNGIADIDIATSAFRKITRTAALLDITNSALRAGTTYWIYDVGDGLGHTTAATAYAGIILRAASANLFDSTGIFISRNVNRTAVPILWNYGTSYALGTFVENFNGVFEATVAGTNATLNPAANSGEWAFIGRADNTKYVTEIHRCAYDIATDSILQRGDNRGNVFTLYNSSTPSNNDIVLKCFRWGYTGFINNKVNINLASINSSGTPMPSQGNLRLNAVEGTVTNNLVEIVASTNFWGTSTLAALAAAPTVNNVFIVNNTIRNSRIALSTNMRMVTNDFSETRVEGNTYAYAGQHIYGNRGSFEILNNTHNTTNALNVNPVFQDTEIINCAADPMLTLQSDSNRIEGNVGTLILNCKLKQSIINGNENMFIYGCNLDVNCEISRNRTDGRKDNDRFISQCSLRSQAFISNNTFIGYPLLSGGIIQKLIYGTLTNRYSYITNVLFSAGSASGLDKDILLNGSPYTLKTQQVAGFTLDNLHIDGAYTYSFPVSTPTPKYSPIYTVAGSSIPTFISSQVNDSYSGINMNNAANNAYAFLRLEDCLIGNTLTIPNSCVHASIFILHQDAGGGSVSIDTIVINTPYFTVGGGGLKSPYIGPWKFINGRSTASTITFNLTSIGSIGANQIARTSALSSVVLAQSTDALEIVKQGSYYSVKNVQLVA